MRRMLLCAAAVALVAACRTEGTQDQALGSEKQPGTQLDMPNDRSMREYSHKGDQDKSGTPGADTGANQDVDRMTRIFAVLDSMNKGELDMAKMAEDHAASKDVKDYATKLKAEHEQDGDAMRKLLSSKKIDLGDARSDPLYKAHEAAAKATMKKLDGLKGAAFDAAYLEAQPDSHELMLQLAKEGADLTNDVEIKGFFNTLVGQAKDHEDKALASIPKQCGGGVGTPVDQTADGSAKAKSGDVDKGKARRIENKGGGVQAPATGDTTRGNPPSTPGMDMKNDLNAPARPQTEPPRDDAMPGMATPPERMK